MTNLIKAWNHYWFRPFPVFYLGLSRVVAVATQLFVMAVFRKLPVEFVQVNQLPEIYWPLPIVRMLSFPMGWDWVPSLAAFNAIYWVTLIAGAFALVGFFTRTSLGVLTIGSLFMQGYLYSFDDIHHTDAIMMIFLIFLILSPSGQALSLDARFKKNKSNPFEPTSDAALWPLLALQWFIAIIYFSAFYAKVAEAGFEWANGITLQYYYLRAWLYKGMDIAEWFARQNLLAFLFSWTTLLFEALFLLVMWKRRLLWIFLAVGIGFHVSIALFVNAWFIELLALYVVFLPWLLDMVPNVRDRLGLPKI